MDPLKALSEHRNGSTNVLMLTGRAMAVSRSLCAAAAATTLGMEWNGKCLLKQIVHFRCAIREVEEEEAFSLLRHIEIRNRAASAHER